MHVSLIRRGMTLDGHKITGVTTVVRQGKPRVKVELSNGRYRLVKPNGTLPVDGYVNGIPGGPVRSRIGSSPTVRAHEDRLPCLNRWGRTVANCPAYDL